MDAKQATSCTAFVAGRRVGAGTPEEVYRILRDSGLTGAMVFDDASAQLLEFEAFERSQAVPRLPGRPRLGVVAREVTLLPRHWEWLSAQPGGASVALRKLVDQARKTQADADAQRRAREVTYRFLSAMAGNFPGFEEAIRGLFAGDTARFAAGMRDWPEDVRAYALALSSPPTACNAG